MFKVRFLIVLYVGIAGDSGRICCDNVRSKREVGSIHVATRFLNNTSLHLVTTLLFSHVRCSVGLVAS